MRFNLLIFVVTVVTGIGASSTQRHVLHERRSTSVDGLQKRDRMNGETVIPLRIGLKQRNLHQGDGWLREVSSPQNPRYGQYYTAKEVHDLFAPSGESVGAVRAWLEDAGISSDRISQSSNRQWIQADLRIDEANDLLKTTYHSYEHDPSGSSYVGCDDYYLHEDVRPHIDYITPGIKMLATSKGKFNQVRKRGFKGPSGWAPPSILPPPAGPAGVNGTSLQGCSTALTAACIRALYNMTEATSAQPGNELGIFERGDHYDQLDLDSYFTSYEPRIPNGTHPTLHGIDGGTSPVNFTHFYAESMLDLSIAYPIIWPQSIVLYQTDDNWYTANKKEDIGFFNTFLDAIDGSYCSFSAYGLSGDSPIDPQYPDPNPGGYKGQLQCGVWEPTNVISLSYGLAEMGAGIPSNYQQRQCAEYMKLGMQGVSLVFASGDSGVGSRSGCLGDNGTVFSPDFPAGCPYITAVGATALLEDADIKPDAEIANGISGGGFSNIYPRPSYQDAAVDGFFKSPAAPNFPYYTGSTYGKGVYNRSSRGYPDLSANGGPVALFGGGDLVTAYGTSASAPIFASMLTRINDARLAANKSVIGFVNPVLYQNPQAFHDITEGSNGDCKSDGFNATVGWDPITGLGTPNYPALLEVFMALP